MQKNLKAKLEKFSRDQLLDLLEELSNVPDVQKMIKAMVSPSKGDIDRLVQKLDVRCEIYMCNSCNAKDYDQMQLPRLDTLFLAMPVSWKGTLAQYAGRLHRNYEGKEEILIYDYVDIRIPMLERMYHKRLSGYAAIGYTIRGDRSVPAAENRIFSQEAYWEMFSTDIGNAQRKILITSPYLHIAQVKRFLNLIPEGVKVTVVTGDASSFKPEAWEKVSKGVKLLEDNGATVILQPKVYQRYAVIDNSILWYGGINFLGFEKAAHGAMRLCSTELASELTSYMNTPNKYEQLEMY